MGAAVVGALVLLVSCVVPVTHVYNTRIGYVSDMFWPMGIHYYTGTIHFRLIDSTRIHGLPFWEPLVLAVARAASSIYASSDGGLPMH